MKKIWMILPAVLLAFGLVFTGCGGDGGGGGGDPVLVFSLDDWFTNYVDPSETSDNNFKNSPLARSGTPTISIDKVNKEINVTGRAKDWDSVNIMIRGTSSDYISLDLPTGKTFQVIVEGTLAGGGDIKLGGTMGSSYPAYGKITVPSTGAFTIDTTIPTSYTGVNLTIQTETGSDGNNSSNITITNIEVWAEATPWEGTPFTYEFGALDTAISDAKAALVGVVASDDGNDVFSTTYWATASDIADFQAAIAAAEAIKTTATSQEDVDDAVQPLKDATNTFTGTTIAVGNINGSTLFSNITAAQTALVGVVISTDGDDVRNDTYWVTASDIADFQAAIAVAQDVVSNPVDQSTVDTAASTLSTATTDFTNAKALGSIDTSALDTAIGTAETLIAATAVASAAEFVNSDDSFVSSDVAAAYQAAINAAKAVSASPSSSTAVSGAINDLSDATDVFSGEVDVGTWTAGDDYTFDLSRLIGSDFTAITDGVVTTASANEELAKGDSGRVAFAPPLPSGFDLNDYSTVTVAGYFLGADGNPLDNSTNGNWATVKFIADATNKWSTQLLQLNNYGISAWSGNDNCYGATVTAGLKAANDGWGIALGITPSGITAGATSLVITEIKFEN